MVSQMLGSKASHCDDSAVACQRLFECGCKIVALRFQGGKPKVHPILKQRLSRSCLAIGDNFGVTANDTDVSHPQYPEDFGAMSKELGHGQRSCRTSPTSLNRIWFHDVANGKGMLSAPSDSSLEFADEHPASSRARSRCPC